MAILLFVLNGRIAFSCSTPRIARVRRFGRAAPGRWKGVLMIVVGLIALVAARDLHALAPASV